MHFAILHGNMMIIIENPLELEVVWGSLFSFIFNQIQTEFDYAGSLMMPAAVGRLGTVHIDCNWKTMLWGYEMLLRRGVKKCVPVEWCNMMQYDAMLLLCTASWCHLCHYDQNLPDSDMARITCQDISRHCFSIVLNDLNEPHDTC